ncbi:MAG TPA: crotonase/enoyl-CoA hydratase family protein [Solirubrobacteraceae bacterium]|jgi:enoyl-CoA hydratase|nr:crotonase/enoyl-CoA hydratase family protein [Solirubrobacteraceae bacterium]
MSDTLKPIEMGVHYESEGPIRVITLDRPEVANAIDAPTALKLADAFRRFDAEETASVAVLTGANGTFCAGADLKAMRSGEPERVTRLAPDGDGPVGPTRMLLSKPVIAAVEGHAVAGGLELAAWCDLRVASEGAVFGVYCRRWGIPLMDGGTVRLTRLLGQSHALDLILTGRGVSGEEALRMGLANRVVPNGEALAGALELAREISGKPQAAMRSDRLSSYEQWSLTLEGALAGEYEHGMRTLQTGEMFGGLEDYASGGWRAERET